MKNALRKSLYMLTQEELAGQVEKECKAEGVQYKKDDYGNIWSIRYKDKPIFVAHMDTVIGDDKNYKVPVKIEGDKLFRPGYVLGADDRAGVNLILNHKKNINFILTKDEEVGAIGAGELESNQEFIKDLEIGTFFIELDRRGKSDIIGNMHGYCNEDVVDEIIKVLPEYEECYGVFTDIDAWVDLRQGINISVGYENAHTNKEYLSISHFEYINSKIIELSNIENQNFRCVVPKSKRFGSYSGLFTSKYSKSYGYFGTDLKSKNKSMFDYCDWCGNLETDLKVVGNEKYCSSCIDYIKKNGTYEVPKVDRKTCSVCSENIEEGEYYIDIPDWEIIVCGNCYDEKRNPWR